MPYITGDVTNDKIWMSFPLPDDPQFIAAFCGAIDAMGKEWQWEQVYDSATVAQAVAYAVYAYENRIRSVPQELVTGVRIQGIKIQVRDANGDWSDAGDLCIDCHDPSPTLLPELDTTGHLCAAVVQTIDWLSDKQLIWLNYADLYIQGTITVTDFFIGWAEALSGGILEILPVDEFVSSTIGLIQSSIDLIRTEQQNVDFLDEAKETLYCLIKDAGQPYTLTEAIFNQWCDLYDHVGVLPTIAGEIGAIARLSVKYSGVLDRFKLYSADTENDCELLYDCASEGCYNFDFRNFPSMPSEITFGGGYGSLFNGIGIRMSLQDAGGGLWRSRTNLVFTGAPVGSVLTSINTITQHQGILPLTNSFSLNLWSDGQVDTPQLFDPNLNAQSFTPNISIAPPDFTIPAVYQADTAANITNAAYTVQQLEICGNSILTDWLASIDPSP